MRIGFLLPANFALAHAGNGVRVQAEAQANALRALGHGVTLLDAWTPFAPEACDVVHFFSGGFPHYRIGPILRMVSSRCRLVFSPIIDSNVAGRPYRLAAALGRLHPKLFTIPGELSRQALDADAVVCRSAAERQRVIHGLGVSPAKAHIVLNGVSPPRIDIDALGVRQLFGLPEAFCLHVSAYTQPRKNVERLIKAVGPTGLPLVIAGIATDAALLARLKLAAQPYPAIRFLDYLPPAQRDSLYAAAKVFCLPSEHEGTGLVALEAASYGAAIVITRRGGPPDYFLDMAEYADPASVEDIRAAVLRAWETPRSDRLRQHVNGTLSWGQSAEGLLKVYEAAAR
ncbi:MAG: glycosyltransferase family 4 protein [Pseudomonadota bacterium]